MVTFTSALLIVAAAAFGVTLCVKGLRGMARNFKPDNLGNSRGPRN